MFLSKMTGRMILIIVGFITFTELANSMPKLNFEKSENYSKSKFKTLTKNFLKNNKLEIISGSASALSMIIFCTSLYFYLTNSTIDRENGLIFLKWTPILSLGMGVSTGLLTKLMLKFDNLKNFCPNPLQSFSQIR